MILKAFLLFSITAAAVNGVAGRNRSSTPASTTRIIGGQVAQKHEFPWLVHLEILINGEPFRCGGSLISMRTVLTAAHCLFRNNNYASWVQVYAGKHDLEKYDEESEQFSETSVFTIHEEFSEKAMTNDIALIHLRKPFVETSAVRAIRLPSSRFVCKKSGTVAGWGATDHGDPPTLATTIRKVTLPIRRGFYCRRQIRAKRKQFCSGRAGRDSCQGDSGAAFVCSTKPDTIYGIVSYRTTTKCAVRNRPAVYTRVPAYSSWIRIKSASTNTTNAIFNY